MSNLPHSSRQCLEDFRRLFWGRHRRRPSCLTHPVRIEVRRRQQAEGGQMLNICHLNLCM